MKLYMPIFFGDTMITECEIKKPTPGVIADTNKLMEEGKTGSAILAFVSGCIESYKDNNDKVIDGKEKIKTITREMKQRCAEDVAIDIVLTLDEFDGVEGVYHCPRCGEKVIAENKDDIDTLDYISQLEVEYFDGTEDYFESTLENPFEIVEKKTVTEVVRTIGFRYPTLTDFIQASARYGLKDSIRLQHALYVECIKEINGIEVDKSWQNMWGMYMISNLKDIKKDLTPIAKEMNRYGRNRTVKKICLECDKEWSAYINTSNFFVLGLQQN